MTNDAMPFVMRAQAAAELRRWDTVAIEARRAIAADPAMPDGHALLAQALNGKGQNAEALAAAQRGLAIAAESTWLHRLRAVILLDLGRGSDGLAAVDEALRLGADSAAGHAVRAKALDQLNQSHAARIACRRALELAPDQAWIHRVRGDIELHAGDPRAAESGYRAALRSSPNDAVALNNLGVALQRQRRHDEAVLAFKAAVLADPTFVTAKRNTHRVVKNLMRAGTTAAILIVLAIVRMCTMGSKVTPLGSSARAGPEVVAGTIILCVVILAIVIGRLVRRARAWNRAKRLDPELWELFQKLDRDHRQGRI